MLMCDSEKGIGFWSCYVTVRRVRLIFNPPNLRHVLISWSIESNSKAQLSHFAMSILSTCCTSNPMYIIINGSHIKDDDMRDLWDINAATYHIRGHQQTKLTFTETVQGI